MTNPKILIFIDWFYPAYKAGGPLKSVFNIATQLNEDFDFYIITSNQDVDGELLDVSINKWTTFQGIDLIYLSKEHQNRNQYEKLFQEVQPEIIYYNSLFSFRFSLLPYLLFKKKKVKQMIAPRGMLGSGALAIKSLKKKVFLSLSKQLFFNMKKIIWHATSAQEAEEIKAAYGKKSNIRIAQNISSAKVERETIQKEKGKLKLVFIARLAEKKNLYFALELMQALKEEGGLSLDIYGPIEEQSYWNKCESIIKKDVRIQYKGILAPHEIAFTLQQYHFYILPTLHENYGHSIVEAIVSGVSIIISNNTPWLNLKETGIGADLDLNRTAEWVNYLKFALSLTQDEYNAMVRNCYDYAQKYILSSAAVEDSKKLFLF